MVAVAAARSGSRLEDRYYGLTHNFSRDRGIRHTEILAPDDAPGWVYDREQLWNRVEAREVRRDAQLARSIDIAVPVELATAHASVALLRDFIASEFVARRMIVDWSLHHRPDSYPKAQLLLTLRRAEGQSFGPKVREWNGKSNLVDWRSSWAEHANRHLARAGCAVRIDHRSLEAQHIELAPARRLGFGSAPHQTARRDEQARIVRENGEAIIEDPTLALRTLGRQRASFAVTDIENFLRSRTADAEQFDAALAAVMTCEDLIPLERSVVAPTFTTRELIEAERSLHKRATVLGGRRGHAVPPSPEHAAEILALQPPQRASFERLIGDAGFIAWATSGGADMQPLRLAHASWRAADRRVALMGESRLATHRLQQALNVPCLPLRAWDEAHAVQVLVVYGAEMMSVRPLEKLLAFSDKAHAKLVTIADAEQIAAMRAGSPLFALLDPTRSSSDTRLGKMQR